MQRCPMRMRWRGSWWRWSLLVVVLASGCSDVAASSSSSPSSDDASSGRPSLEICSPKVLRTIRGSTAAEVMDQLLAGTGSTYEQIGSAANGTVSFRVTEHPDRNRTVNVPIINGSYLYFETAEEPC